jgi:YD repeat-containing protein
VAGDGSLPEGTTIWTTAYDEVTSPAAAGKLGGGTYLLVWAGLIEPDGHSFTGPSLDIYSGLVGRTTDFTWQKTTIHYGYDPLYRLTSASYTGDIEAGYSCVYDGVGNMTAYTETAGAETTSMLRAFDAANRLETSDDGRGETSYTYDGNGNLLAVAGTASGQSYRYDQRNLLTGVTTGPSEFKLVDYIYDGAGNRVQQISYLDNQPVSVVTYTNDVIGLAQVLIADDGTTQTANLFGLSLIHQDNGVEIRSLLSDALGSVRQEIVGGVVESASTNDNWGDLGSYRGKR